MTDVLRLHAARSRGSLPMRADAESNTSKAGSTPLRRRDSRAALAPLQPNALHENDNALLPNQIKQGFFPRRKNFSRVPSRTSSHWAALIAESQEEGIVKPDATVPTTSDALTVKPEVAVATSDHPTAKTNITTAGSNAATAKRNADAAEPNNKVSTHGARAISTTAITTAIATTETPLALDEPSSEALATSPPPPIASIGATAFVSTSPRPVATATTAIFAPSLSGPRPILSVSTAQANFVTPSLYFSSPTSTTHSIPLQTPIESYREAYIHLARGTSKDDDETALSRSFELHEMVELHLPVAEEKNAMSLERAQDDALREPSAKATTIDLHAESVPATATPATITAIDAVKTHDATNTPTACSTSAPSTSTLSSTVAFEEVRAAVRDALGELRGVERVDLVTGSAEEQAAWVSNVLATAGCSTAVTLTKQAGSLPLRLRGSAVKLWVVARAPAPATSPNAAEHNPQWEIVRSYVRLPDADCDVLNGLQLNTWAKKHALLALVQPYGLLNDPAVDAAVALARLPTAIPANASSDDVPLLALKRLSPAQYAIVNASDAARAAWYREIKRLWQLECVVAACGTEKKAVEGASE